MKKLLLLAAVVLCSLGHAQNKGASPSKAKDWRFGIKAGLNIANLTNTDETGISVSSRTGVNTGIYLHHKFGGKWAFQPELLYTTQGNIQRGSSQGIDVKITYMLDYIAVPLMFKYYPAKNFNLEFGPQLAFIVSKKLKGEGNGQSLTYDLDDFFAANGLDIKTNTFDLALNFGLGYELDNGLNFSGRYSLGMIKIFKGSDAVDSNGNDQIIKNSVFSFGLGYTFK